MIQTERLQFRTWKPDDLPLAQTLWGDPVVMTYLDVRGALTQEQVREKLATEIAFQEKVGLQYWPMFEASTGEFVGCCGLKPWLHSSYDFPEIGFHLVQTKWGKGYAPEAARGVIRYATENLKVAKLMAGHHPENFGSKKILGNLGFSFLEKVLFKPTGLYHLSYQLSLFNQAGSGAVS